MEDLNNLIDATTFGTVRRYLRVAPSPTTTVMLVRHRDTLPRVGTVLVADQGGGGTSHRRQWAEWFSSGEVRIGGAATDADHGTDLDAIPDSVRCDALYLPPVYLVCLRSYRAPVVRRAEA